MTPPILAHVYAPRPGAVLLVVQRARDGWIALDLAGRTTDEALGEDGERFVVTQGGASHADRIFALHDRLDEIAAGRALAVGTARGPRFAFGGDLFALWAAARRELAPNLRFFRGLTVLREAAARLGRGLPASAELVFATPAGLVEVEFARAGSPRARAGRGARAGRRESAPRGRRARSRSALRGAVRALRGAHFPRFDAPRFALARGAAADFAERATCSAALFATSFGSAAHAQIAQRERSWRNAGQCSRPK